MPKIAVGNAGWRFQFRFAVHGFWSRAPELWTFDLLTEHVLGYSRIGLASLQRSAHEG
jgi:hypothetical protein